MAMGLLYMLVLWPNVCIVSALDPMVVRGQCNLSVWSLQNGHH
jgi:hypothetical protein